MVAPLSEPTSSAAALNASRATSFCQLKVERLAKTRAIFASDGAIKIGVSSCLLGAKVRFDAGHKRCDFLVESLGGFVEFVPVCPEVEIGLGVPREPVHLVQVSNNSPGTRMVGSHTGTDLTDKMKAYAERRVLALRGEDLSGYVLKKNSPSCGIEGVPIEGSSLASAEGPGLFAAALMRHYPGLPVAEEGHLADPQLRESFVERVFAYRRLRSFFLSRWTVGGLVEFHSAHKLTLMAHSPTAYTELGRFVTRAKPRPRVRIRESYELAFMDALKPIATAASHTNVLRHVVGSLRPHLDRDSHNGLVDVIEQYRCGLVPLVVPVALLREYVRKFKLAELRRQVYLEPHPKELIIRSHL